MKMVYNSVKLQTVDGEIEKGECKVIILWACEQSEVYWHKPWTWFPNFETKYTVGPAKWVDGKVEQQGYMVDTKEEAKELKQELRDKVNDG